MEKIGMEYVNCNLCGADDAKIVYEWGKINVVRCRKCGLIYKNPRYPEEKILSRPEEDERIDDSGSAAKRQMFERQIVKIESLVGKGRILDVGCGQGDFLKIAMDRGWNAQGIEVSDRQYAAAKKKHGLNVFNGTIKQAGLPGSYFDAVTMWDSLDFMYNPSGELTQACRVLKPGGLIFVRVRNAVFHIPLKRILRDSPAIVHTYSFSSKTIRLVLEKAGFRKIMVMNSKVTGNSPFSFFLNLAISFLDFAGNSSVILSPSLLVYARK